MNLNFLIKGLIVVFLFSASAISELQAQQEGRKKESSTPEEIAERKATRLKDKLTLTEDQYKQVYSLFLENANNWKSQKESMKNLDKTQRDEMRKKHREEMKGKMQSILTKEQMDQWEKMKSQHNGKRSKGKNRNGSDSQTPKSPAEK